MSLSSPITLFSSSLLLLFLLNLGYKILAESGLVRMEPAVKLTRQVYKTGGRWCYTKRCGGEQPDGPGPHGVSCPSSHCGDRWIDEEYYDCLKPGQILMKSEKGDYFFCLQNVEVEVKVEIGGEKKVEGKGKVEGEGEGDGEGGNKGDEQNEREREVEVEEV